MLCDDSDVEIDDHDRRSARQKVQQPYHQAQKPSNVVQPGGFDECAKAQRSARCPETVLSWLDVELVPTQVHVRRRHRGMGFRVSGLGFKV